MSFALDVGSTLQRASQARKNSQEDHGGGVELQRRESELGGESCQLGDSQIDSVNCREGR